MSVSQVPCEFFGVEFDISKVDQKFHDLGKKMGKSLMSFCIKMSFVELRSQIFITVPFSFVAVKFQF